MNKTQNLQAAEENQKLSENADLAANSDNQKTRYDSNTISLISDNLKRSISQILTDEENSELFRIVRKLLENDCRLQIMYQVIYSED